MNSVLPRGILVTQFIEDINTMSDGLVADKYNISFRTLRRWKQKIRESEEDISSSMFPESPSPVYDNYLKLNYDRVIIIGDCECPDHDSQMFEMAVRLADRLSCEHLIINGDFMAMDSFSNWPQDNPQHTSFERDLGLAIDSIKTFLNTFDTVDYIIGNHERRLAKQNKGQSNIGLYMRHILGLQYSNYPYLELTSGGREIIVVHPEDYSRAPLVVPRKLAAVYDKSILCGHTHALEQGWSDNGKHWIACGGHMRDEKRTLYKSMKLASNPKWQSGFSIIIDGNLYLVNKHNIDFWMNNVNLD